MTTEVATSEIRLGVVSSVLGAVNTESKILLLGSIPEDGITAVGIHESLGEGMTPLQRERLRPPFTIRQDMQQFENGGLVTSSDAKGPHRRYLLTAAGGLAVGVGGILLPASHEYNVELLPFVGQKIVDERRNSIATRLTVLCALRKLTPLEWISVPELSRFVQESLGTTHIAARRSISGLEKGGIIDKKEGRNYRNMPQYEVKLADSDAKNYRAFLEEYMKAVHAVAVLDMPTIAASASALQVFMHRARANNSIGTLMQRSQSASKHFGVSRPKKPKD